MLDKKTGKEIKAWNSSAYDIKAMDVAPDGKTFYTVANGRLNRTVIDRTNGELSHTPLGNLRVNGLASLDVSETRIVVGDRDAHAIHILDREGNVLGKIGGKGPRVPGPWDPDLIHKPSGVGFDSAGNIWVAEESFAPKRVAKYNANGQFVDEFFGPPMYGGGGRLDPDLKNFYYRSMHFSLDWDKGRSDLIALNDRARHPKSIAPGGNTFSFTPMGRPMYRNGKRFLVSGKRIVKRDDDSLVWKPAVAIGAAHKSSFLLGKDVWKRHWAKFDLMDKGYIWCDKNDDGDFQVDEVELFELENKEFLRGAVVGKDFSFWGKDARLKPYDYTEEGVPLYKSEDLQAFDYASLAPHYNRNYTLAGDTSAKPSYFGLMYVSEDGYLAQEGQPFVVKPDGSILGGKPEKGASDYVPPIVGHVVATPWSWGGGGPTNSDVGEIAIINSYAGVWHIWAVKHGVMLGRIFTGEEGGWHDFKPVAGTDVTKRKFAWEGWFSDVVKGHDGHFYAQGGKNFHAISRIEGMDDFKITSSQVDVESEDEMKAEFLRDVLVKRARAARGVSAEIFPAKERLKAHKLDGELEDWGKKDRMLPIGEEGATKFEAVTTSKGLLIALDGWADLGGAAGTVEQALENAFALSVAFRGKRSGDRNLVTGDRRFVFTKVKGQWIAVSHQYILEGGLTKKGASFQSDFTSFDVHEIRTLTPNEIEFVVLENALDIDLMAIGDGDDLGMGLEPKKKPDGAKKHSGQKFTAEILLPWETLGVAGPDRGFRLDVGVRDAGKGTTPEDWVYWSNAYVGPQEDDALRRLPNPTAWGRIEFVRSGGKRRK